MISYFSTKLETILWNYILWYISTIFEFDRHAIES